MSCEKKEHTLNHPNKQAPVALITGAARRIGKAIAELLHEKGFKIILHAHNSITEAQALADSLNQNKPNTAHVLTADLTNKQDALALIKNAIIRENRLDVLVNNASIFKRTDFNNLKDEDWDALFTTNVRAPFWLSHSARPYLAREKGCIINLTDIHAERPLKDYAVYCQTKAALLMQTKTLAREFAPDVRVNAVAPGAIVWPENENALSNETKEKVIKATPLQQHGIRC